MSTRRPVKFTSLDGNISYTFPREQLEYEAAQQLAGSSIPLVGADYAYDVLEDGLALKQVGIQTVRFLLVGAPAAIEAELDAMNEALYTAARGWFYLEDDSGIQRRAVCRLQQMPGITLGTRNRQTAPVVLMWQQFSDFFDVANIDEHEGAVQLVSGDPDTISVINPGNARVNNAVIIVKGPFDGLRIENTSCVIPGTVQPYVFESDRFAAAAAHQIKIDAGANTVEHSTDSGASWSDDSGNVVLQDGQVGLMAFAPGLNALIVAGADTAEIDFEFAGAWL